MTYTSWHQEHQKKHSAILKKLEKQNYTKEQIVEYFDFENMCKNEKDFCLLYAEEKKCHDIPSLNCYFCACPHFIYDDKGLKKEDNFTYYSQCSLGSGGTFFHNLDAHQDCSNCTIPHSKEYVLAKI